ncbi:MAG: type III pantothenate kinase [Cyanobacteriota bacterium]|nr:type III pantothenate kinase [Cyanobacteriota bacterium]
MRHPSAGCDGRGYLSLETPHWLLVGNSRWHWGAQNRHPSLCCWSESPADGEKRAAALGSKGLVAWAAVGPAPESLPRLQRITTAEVPLVGAPPWLGVDRALAGWRAWQRQGAAHSVLVADAGTALSLTRVDAGGKFAGGRLLAGAGLQLRALAQATLALPALAPEALMDEAAGWPQATESALVVGIVRGLAAALTSAAEEARISEPQPCRLWLTGGDGPLLAPVLQSAGQSWRLEPDLVVEALTGLRPAPDR